MGAASYHTLSAGVEVTGEFEDRRSRFIAQLVHVGSEAEAEAHIAAVRTRHHDARHNVPAWILADGRERCSDDGEPSRTSGMPTLDVLKGAGLADVCCVVTRYFGGTLLGPGGLVRAYTAATQAAAQAARRQGAIVEMTLVTPVTAQVPYALYDRCARLVSDAGGKVADSLFAEDVQLTCLFHAGDEQRFIDAMRELACGEDLGMVPDCVSGVMDHEKILSLKMRGMESEGGWKELSVCATSSHDMETLRMQCETDPEPWQVRNMLWEFLASPSMLAIFPIQDWVALDAAFRRADRSEERINQPADPRHKWRFRLHFNLEELSGRSGLNAEIEGLIKDSTRYYKEA